MTEPIKDKTLLLGSLPDETNHDFMPDIQKRLVHTKSKIVILDDDPTGTQTVHNIPVLTTWDVESLCHALRSNEPAFFILTNTRAFTQDEAVALSHAVGMNLKAASRKTQVPVDVISRSDSTLRGHFPAEVDAVAKTMEEEHLPYLICPFFFEGGRLTIDDVHYVAEGDELIPAAQTPYAQDATFGFGQSNLKAWVAEKTNGRIPAEQVVSISLKDIRDGGPQAIAGILGDVLEKGACIVNAASYKDMEVFVAGLDLALEKGKRFLYRTAASFVRVRTGVIPKKAYLSRDDLIVDTKAGGLFVVGSYVPKTTAQVKALQEQPDVNAIEIEVEKILDSETVSDEVGRVIDHANQSLTSGKDTLIYTSRKLLASDDPEKSRLIGQAVSKSLIDVVQGITVQPRYLVAKGGITSSDVATIGLNVKKAMVIGQALPGVPVWELGNEAVYPGMAYIVFPGNVGDDTALAEVRNRLKG